jgi:hypothetical protein
MTRFTSAALLLSACLSPVACETATAPFVSTELGLGDLSFLLPLEGHDFGANSRGGHGVVLPRVRFDALEPLTRVDEPEVLYAGLKVVGVRLDGCFFEGAEATACDSQVRLVLQPVLEVDGILTTRDAALHAFYGVPLEEVRELAARLAGTHDGSAGIGVHRAPEKAASLVLQHVGERRLKRVTAMSVHPSNDAWIFSGTDIGGVGRPSLPMVIIGVDMTDQHVTSTGGRETLAATLLPDPVIEPTIANYLDARRRDGLGESERTAAIAALARLLDPAIHNSGTVDCASCHVATSAYRFATRMADDEAVPMAYDDTRNQRMFGYFGREPSISPRVVAETRLVLEWLETSE